MNANALASALVGIALAAAGVLSGPRVIARENLDRALAVSASATAAAAAWGLWRNQLLATMLPFLVVSYGLGEWRARRARRAGAS